MSKLTTPEHQRVGLIGVGAMGAALADNLLRNGCEVALWDTNDANPKDFASAQARGSEAPQISVQASLKSLTQHLSSPRVIFLMINAGPPVDQTLEDLAPLLTAGDIVVDCGNSHFPDSIRRGQACAEHGIEFVGLGVSGGPQGAREGPSFMFGGSRDAWHTLEPLLTPMAAQSQWGPCIAWLGPAGAGHFSKMVHNGIEYGDMQLLAEAYQLLRDVTELDAAQIGGIFEQWQRGPLGSFLTELSARVLRSTDLATNQPWVDLIADQAGQKGTGRWTLIHAVELGVPIPTIGAAVDARALSATREPASSLHQKKTSESSKSPNNTGNDKQFASTLASTLGSALLLGRLCAYAQGFQLIRTGAEVFTWPIEPLLLAKAWTGGCIIRSRLLDEVIAALQADVALDDLTTCPTFATLVDTHLPALSQVVEWGVTNNIPLPALSASLNWLLTKRSVRSAQNLVQAQRDAFGQHGFQRVDDPTGSVHHGTWDT